METHFIQECLDELLEIKQRIKEYAISKEINVLEEDAHLSLLNMYHYLKFRSLERTLLQDKLVKLGLSSLGRSHPHLLDSINQIIIILSKLQGLEYDKIDNKLNYDHAYKILQNNFRIFGETDKNTNNRFTTKIMITLPSEAAQNDKLIPSFYKSGAELFRINTAHDTPADWCIMAKTIQSIESQNPPKIYVDLAGPKIRTSTIFRIKKKTKEYDEYKVFQGDKILISGTIEASLINHALDSSITAYIGCSNQEVIQYVKVNDKVFIDDGKIELITRQKCDDCIVCEVTRAKLTGTMIRQEKGINFPDSNIKLEALTDEDQKNLNAIVPFADIIGISFCQDKEDVKMLRNLLLSLNRQDIAIVAKIETKKGVENLPEILEALIEHGRSGIMIARGDLAIEVGFENLSVIQEEILNLCEAAHMPIIYATQVLENLMKTNLPSRAEITDAAFAQRADCIMLNKGAYADDAIKILHKILKSMHKLFRKNRQLLSVGVLFKF